MGEHGEAHKTYVSLAVFVIGGLITWFAGLEQATALALTASVAFLGILSAKELVEERKLGVDLLMAIVGFILLVNNVIFESLIIYGLYVIAEIMEGVVESLAVRNLKAAQKLVPRRVLVERDGVSREVDIDEVKPGDVIVVRKGEIVPVDSVLIDETGVFDSRYITGEAVPVEAKKGDVLESGYINVGKPVRVKALRKAQDSALQVIVSRTIEMLERKSRAEKLIERMAPYMIVGVLVLFTPTYVVLGERAVAILLAGCPSAFIILSSVNTMYSVAVLARRGIVVKGGEALEQASKVGALVIDKTGTLTLGLPKPVKAIPPRGLDETTFKSLVASVAAASLHPVSRGIAKAWKPGYTVTEVEEIPGRGVKARVNGSTLVLGSRPFIESILGEGVDGGACGSDIAVYALVDGSVGMVCLGEEVSDDAARAVETLKRMGMRVVLASGDRKERVEAVAKALGIDEYYYGMKPDDKLRLTERIREECKCKVAMIGDGINDIEAMAAADLGIAVGNIDVINEVADAVLLRGFKDTPHLLKRGKGYMGGILFGIGVASIIKLAVIVLGLGGSIPLWLVALIGDDGSTLIGTAAAVLYTTISSRL